VDGDPSDFSADEKLAGDPTGDSSYGANNDLSTLHVTWDAQRLYLGFGYKAWNTAVMYLVETGESGGVSSFCPPGYSGGFPANVVGPGFDLMIAFFATPDAAAPVPYVYALASGSSTDITSSTGVQVAIDDVADTTATNPLHTGSVEVAIQWDVIYGLGAGVVPTGASLQIAGALRGQSDGDGLGDASPDPTGGVQGSACGATATDLDVFHLLTVDASGDGVPDEGWAPATNSGTSDAGVPDSGPTPDLTPPPDLVPAPDAATTTDLPLARDQGAADQARATDGPPADLAAGSDAAAGDGPLGAADGAASADATAGGDRQDEGCACSARGDRTGAMSSLALVALLALGLLDRRRRH
jgi:uncharacterized protein (TIGR03382 family)